MGNDVVDLGDPWNARAHERSRLVGRICREEERSAVERSRDPAALLWSFFAAKEAAFKLACKLGPREAGEGPHRPTRPTFAHRLFEVEPELGFVRWEGRVFSLGVEREGELVHAVVWVGERIPFAGVAEVRAGADLGVEARGLLARSLAPRLGCSPSVLTVVREGDPASWDDLGPPRLLCAGTPVDLDVSLSHDGRFVAFACV